MAEAEDLDPFGGPIPLPDEDSGSAYGTSDSEHSLSYGEEGRSESRDLSPSRGREEKTIQTAPAQSLDEHLGEHESSSDAEEELEDAGPVNDEIRQNALAWAANFEAPGSPSEIRTPNRQSISRPRKRKLQKPASEHRAKRLKPYQNTKYRELLNIDIHDAATRMVHGGEQSSLPKSQLGISIWTSQEKDRLFEALQRLGRDDIRGISARIGSKSEQEVQEYILLLHQGSVEKQDRDGRHLPLTEISAAMEISDECCAILERAGQALASRQELDEEKTEKGKWGDIWLVTDPVARRLDKYQRQDDPEVDIDQVLPATNLFHLRTWLELSSRVFMNSDVDENWNDLAEKGENPAVRATAFEDFHSLTVSYTKRAVSSTLFCAMSREKATNSRKVKHAEIKPEDVDAAIAILKGKKNSDEFWIKSARRNKLRIIDGDDDDDESTEVDEVMTYDAVEAALRSPSTNHPASAQVDEERSDTSSISSLDSEPSYETKALSTSGHSTDASNRRERAQKRARSHIAALRAEEAQIEAFDMRSSKEEEIKLWEILEQEPPFEIVKDEPGEEDGRVKGAREGRDGEDWREWTERVGVWEGVERPVPEEAFVRNRVRRSKRARRRVERGGADVGNEVDGSESDEEGHAEGDELAVEREDEDEEDEISSVEQDDIEEFDDDESIPEEPQWFHADESLAARQRSLSDDMSEQGVGVKVEEWD
jgi:hypothetical protein